MQLWIVVVKSKVEECTCWVIPSGETPEGVIRQGSDTLGLITKQVYEMADAATKMVLRRSYLYPANLKE